MQLSALQSLPIRRPIFVLLFMFALVGYGNQAPAAEAKKHPVSVSIASLPMYSSGTFGTTTRTRIIYIPNYIKYRTRDWSVKLVLPYIIVQSNGALISNGRIIGVGQGPTRTRSGIGDVWLDSNYTLHQVLGSAVDLVPYANIKFGTASAAKGLGTGENDYEFGIGARTRLAKRWFPFGRVGYRFVGEPAGRTLNNILTYRFGASYVMNRWNVLTVLFSGRQASQPGFSNAAEVIGAWDYRLRPHLGLQVFGGIGLSNGSPDYDLGAGLKYRF